MQSLRNFSYFLWIFHWPATGQAAYAGNPVSSRALSVPTNSAPGLKVHIIYQMLIYILYICYMLIYIGYNACQLFQEESLNSAKAPAKLLSFSPTPVISILENKFIREKKRFMLLSNLHLWVSVCAYVHAYVGAHRGQKRASEPTELVLSVDVTWWCGCLNLCPLQEQCVLLAAKPSLRPQKSSS